MDKEGIGHAISVWAVNFIADNPTLIGWLILAAVVLCTIFFVASMTCSGIKYRHPVYAEMPPKARFWLGFLMPLALNWWTLSKRVGIQQPPDPGNGQSVAALPGKG
jgi:hypothetical protein